MREYDFFGSRWYWLSRRYPNQTRARLDWEKLMKLDKAQKGKLDLGVYRHGPSEEQGCYVTCVSLAPEGIEYAAKLLGGEDYEQPAMNLDALIARRVRVVHELNESKAREGTHAIRRGTRGAVLHADGTMDEQIGRDM